jgi:hypothetical protein
LGLFIAVSTKHAVVWIAIAICGALIVASPIGDMIGLFLYVGIFQTPFPATISWDAKNAYMKCWGAIADPRIWPTPPAQTCQAMYLCANEALLSARERKALYEQISKTPGCQQP